MSGLNTTLNGKFNNKQGYKSNILRGDKDGRLQRL